MKISIVATLFQSSSHVAEFYRRATDTVRNLVGEDYEIILVNDGSPDNSCAIAIQLAQVDAHLVVVDLSRNFGHHKAMMTGLAHADGERIFLIDSDLEEEPEWLINFSQQMDRDQCDVVYGVQEHRKGGFFERFSGEWFYSFFRALSGIALPRNIVTARLMSRRYVEALLGHEEREVFLAGLWYITGFEQHPQTIKKLNLNKTTYTLSRKMSILVNSITSFTNAPLMGIFYIGVTISILAGIFTVYILIDWLFYSRPPAGWTSVIISIWLLGGLIISFIGIIGIYLSKIFIETKRRPYTIVRKVYGK